MYGTAIWIIIATFPVCPKCETRLTACETRLADCKTQLTDESYKTTFPYLGEWAFAVIELEIIS